MTVKKVKRVRRDNQAKALAKRAKNSKIFKVLILIGPLGKHCQPRQFIPLSPPLKETI